MSDDLRDRIAEALYQWIVQHAGARPLMARDEETLRQNSRDRADAVMAVVQTEIDAQRTRAEDAEEHIRYLGEDVITPERRLHEQTIERAEKAEAAIERVRALAREATEIAERSLARQHGGAPFPAHLPAAEVLAALDQPEEAP